VASPDADKRSTSHPANSERLFRSYAGPDGPGADRIGIMNPPLPSSHDPATEARIRELAYYLWVDAGCPPNNELAHWYDAEKRVLAETRHVVAPPSPHYSIRATLAEHESDPAHRFHNPAHAQDARRGVVAGEARQRVRSRQGKSR
jgi:hypothetical protein